MLSLKCDNRESCSKRYFVGFWGTFVGMVHADESRQCQRHVG